MDAKQRSTTRLPMTSDTRNSLVRASLVCVLTWVLALLCVTISRQPGSLAFVWLPNAVVAVILMRSTATGRGLLVLAFVLGTILANLAYGDSLVFSVGLALANLVEVSVSVTLVRRSGVLPANRLGLLQGLWVMLCLAVLGPIAGGMLGGIVVHQLTGAPTGQVFSNWWTGAGAGALFVGPVALSSRRDWQILRGDRPSALLGALLLLAIVPSALLILALVPFPFVFVAGLFGLMSFMYSPAIGAVTAMLTYTALGLLVLVFGVPSWGHFADHGPEPFWAASTACLLFPYITGLMAEQLRANNEVLAEQIEAARQARHEFEQLFTLMPDAAMLISTDQRVIKANEAAHALFGYPPDALTGLYISTLAAEPVPGVLDHPAIEPLPSTGGVPRYRSVVRAKRQDGHAFVAQSHFAELSWAGTRLTVNIVRDITDALEMQAAVEESRVRAEEASRHKGEFLANMSHELRTPMNGVLGAAQLLESTALSTAQRTYVEIIGAAGQSLLAILNDILDFTKIEAGRMVLVNEEMGLHEVLRSVAPVMMFGAVDKDIELVMDIEPNLPERVRGDSLRIQQVITNLVGNAVKFTSKGQVVLAMSTKDLDDGMVEIRVRVSDTGIGMGADEMSRLFVAFTQAESSMSRRFGGTGLGLAISRRLARQMGGDIEVQSVLGVGSAFTFTVPLRRVQGAPQEVPRPLRGARVLVIMHHPLAMASLGRWLKTWGCEVLTAHSAPFGLRARESAADRGAPFGLVLCDLQLPDLGGFEVLRACKSEESGPPSTLILLSSPQGHIRLSEAAEGVEADEVLYKPVLPFALLEAMGRALAERTGPTAERTEGGAPPWTQRLAGLRVLLAEDNLLSRTVAVSLLRQAGAEVVAASDGMEAVKTLREPGKTFDIILMDIQMPELDGFSATRVIREDLRLDVPILAMSAGVLESERRRCEEAGMNDFIGKPIDLQQLIQIVSRHAPRRPTAPQAPPLPPAPPPAPLDLDRLLSVVSGDPTYLRTIASIVRGMVETGAAPLQEAALAWREGRAEAAGRVYHRLRGSFGTLGAANFSALCGVAEDRIVEGRVDEVEPLLPLLDAELGAVLAAASDWLDRLPRET